MEEGSLVKPVDVCELDNRLKPKRQNGILVSLQMGSEPFLEKPVHWLEAHPVTHLL
jgi:hypothetical protein